MQARGPLNLQGIDVSHWQGDIEWNQVKDSGISFVYIKATEGADHQDSKFAHNLSGAGKAGLVTGAYHFCTPSDTGDALKEARHFVNVVKKNCGFRIMDLPPVIDIEKDCGLTPRAITDIVRIWVEHVGEAAGVSPVIYSYSYFIQKFLGPELGSIPLWLAHYKDTLPQRLAGWDSWVFLQFTDKGLVKGIRGNVDLNEYYGSRWRNRI